MAPRYRAFISYSHVDSNGAEWLQTAIEHFPIDKDLVGRHTKVGVVPETLYPIFRDRSDFGPAGELNESATDALRNSDFLVVLCSPASAKSKHVNQEILLFRSHHKNW